MNHLTTFCFQTYQKDIENVEREWKTVWEVFPELSTIHLSSHSTTHTNISTTHNSIPSIAYTNPSHTYPQITGYLYHTNTTNSCNSTSKSIRTTSTTISINNFSPTMFLKLSLSKKSTKPAHITTPKLHTLTLNKFPLTDTRLKRHKQPLPFKTPKSSFKPHPGTSSKVSIRTFTTTITKSPPNSKISPSNPPKQSTSPTDKKRAPKQTTPTALTNTTATTLTEICPDLAHPQPP